MALARVILTSLKAVRRYLVSREGALAQSVEQWIENPRVPSSILGGATIKTERPTLL